MNLEKAKEQFIQSWGVLGSQWGINRTMAQVHALLLVSENPLTTDEVMEQLNISRGNANMNIRDLIDWGLLEKVIIQGIRKEFFIAEKDPWKVAARILSQRKKRELDPMIKVLDSLSEVEGDKDDPAIKKFTGLMNGFKKLAGYADKTIDTISKYEEQRFLANIIKVFL